MESYSTNEILQRLTKRTNSKGALIVTRDGIPLNKNFNFIEDELKHFAMTSLIVSVAQKLSDLSNSGNLMQMVIQSENGNIILKSINDDALIVLYIPNVFNLDNITKIINEAISEINPNELLCVA